MKSEVEQAVKVAECDLLRPGGHRAGHRRRGAAPHINIVVVVVVPLHRQLVLGQPEVGGGQHDGAVVAVAIHFVHMQF